MQILQNLKNKAKNQQLQRKSPQSNLSPNLLSSKVEDSSFFKTHKDPISRFVKYPIFLLHIAFIVVVVLNIVVNRQITSLEDQTWKMEQILLGQSKTYSQARNLNRKIDLYKSIEQYRPEFNGILEDLLFSFPPNVEVSRITITTLQPTSTRLKALVNMNVPDALTVALLISKLAELPSVEQVTLHSAAYSPRNESFLIDLELDIL